MVECVGRWAVNRVVPIRRRPREQPVSQTMTVPASRTVLLGCAVLGLAVVSGCSSTGKAPAPLSSASTAPPSTTSPSTTSPSTTSPSTESPVGVLDRAKHALAAQKALSVTDDVAATAGGTTVQTTITVMVDTTTKKVVGEILTQRTRTAATVIEGGAKVSVYVTPTVAYFKISAADLLANGASQPYAAA